VFKRSSIGATVAAFAVLGLATIGVVAVAAGLAVQRVTRAQALREARGLTRTTAVSAVEPDLSDGVVSGDPAALARLDRSVRTRVLRVPVARVKLWTLNGRIVYSDEPALIGRRFALGAGEQRAARQGRVDAELSDANRPENVFERGLGRLVEVYLPIRTPSGRRLLWEEYIRYDRITESARRQWFALLPAVGGALLILAIAQLPLAWWLARRLRRREEEREAMLLGAVESSDRERRRMAQALHEGPVQTLAGLSWRLTAAARGSPRPDDAELEATAAQARDALRELRSVLVASHPPSVRRAGLPAALDDVSAPLRSAGIDVRIDLDPDASLGPAAEGLVYRVAEEGLRNAAAHAGAQHVGVVLRQVDGRARLTVRDDGRGFSPETLAESRRDGHRGLELLEDLATEAGGRLDVHSSPEGGTRLELEAPVR
jgi:two-component system, NarL family, sensor kinase